MKLLPTWKIIFIACRPNHDNVTSEARCTALLAASFLRITDLKACDSYGQLGQRITQPFGIFDQMEYMSVSLGIQNSVVPVAKIILRS